MDRIHLTTLLCTVALVVPSVSANAGPPVNNCDYQTVMCNGYNGCDINYTNGAGQTFSSTFPGPLSAAGCAAAAYNLQQALIQQGLNGTGPGKVTSVMCFRQGSSSLNLTSCFMPTMAF